MFKFVFLVLLLMPHTSFAGSGTVVGNGGEPLLHFLEATRFALVQTLRAIRREPAVAKNVCIAESQLTSDQKEFCSEYVLKILDQLLTLNVDPTKVSFALRLDPLLVYGPDGKPMPVSARTSLGPQGAIEFHLDSIKLMAPKSMLHLIAHEFQHKVVFGGTSPTDNNPIGPFPQGRALLDAAASSLVRIATEKGFIGKEFVLRDSFECTVQTGGSPIGMRFSTSRWFFDETLANYEVSLSKRPSDPQVSVMESLRSKIVFQLEVSDKRHCDSMGDLSLRSSHVSLWRVDSDPSVDPVQLTDEVLPGVNPLCDKAPRVFKAVFGANNFACQYYGSAAL